MTEHVQGAPENVKCPLCSNGLVETPTRSRSITGVNTHLYLCTACVKGLWLRWVIDRPGQYLVVSIDTPESKLTRAAFIGLGWLPPKRPKRPEWTPPS